MCATGRAITISILPSRVRIPANNQALRQAVNEEYRENWILKLNLTLVGPGVGARQLMRAAARVFCPCRSGEKKSFCPKSELRTPKWCENHLPKGTGHLIGKSEHTQGSNLGSFKHFSPPGSAVRFTILSIAT